jgi:hypothetical protein
LLSINSLVPDWPASKLKCVNTFLYKSFDTNKLYFIVLFSFHEESSGSQEETGCPPLFSMAEASASDDHDKVDPVKQEEELGAFQILDRLEQATEASASDDQAVNGSVKQEEELGIFQILDKLEQVTDTLLNR